LIGFPILPRPAPGRAIPETLAKINGDRHPLIVKVAIKQIAINGDRHPLIVKVAINQIAS
jgi:hypothetical protein